MKEMLKNKSVIMFIVVMLGITFIGSYRMKLEDIKTSENNYFVYNVQ